MNIVPLRLAELRERTAPDWRIVLHEVTGSTNEDTAAAARQGAAEGLVILAEEQTNGKGRLGRTWVSPRHKGLWLSMLLRPTAPIARWGLIPLLTGTALARTVEDVTGLKAGLKWPNDLLIDDRKCAGILAEAVATAGTSTNAVVVGVGLNVWQSESELPSGPAGLPATSLRLAGANDPDRTSLAADFLNTFRDVYTAWRSTGQLAGYHDRCWSIGRRVRVSLPGDTLITGVATSVDDEGRLIVEQDGGQVCLIAAGDVTHVR
jgi:BirA family biotin operon repressor/biotin-[acetyl-CoA-carboxylase] ligase